ncbi:hypothetical protein EW026_g3587 [Hermanssonia centrifuga]|uniref:ubiquitinyl hydrolase 1 n=1 Tax=Hermanssonia centrifuga TaxID=98765 RepID=A0A4S4KJR2_9APHY|nr:hypothetical protein EW026_g3587 [Hermanssonia centrifuga]
MPLKRLRRASPTAQGLSAGERLKRAKLVGNEYLAWSWVGTEVTDTADITQEHRLATCGFSNTNRSPFCSNKYSTTSNVAAKPGKTTKAQAKTEGELEDDIIVISDNDSPTCSSKACKNNPNCLNYLGQEKWESEEKARDAFIKAQELGPDPTLDSRAFDTPVGLKVWYQDLPFRTGVYKCQPAQDVEHKFEESPIFQLQVTFAAMQMSKQAAFNPVKLVESLKLNTTEQQDAQEFSKLFMAHLDSEFQKQVDPSLKSLIADQGKQVYATVCTNCQNRSERESEFLEIEVTISNNSKLDERIAALLKPEDLDGDNKYLCSKCESLQNAKRYTELRELPPVLHFSLLRFVYDLSTMERKKSKHYILFPKSINMDEFVTTGHQNEAKKEKMGGKNMYHLRGVLLHKGPSAYHGHYEAQIFDVRNEAWYQFNDEVVTKISSLGPSPKVGQKSGSKENGNAKPIKAQMKGKSAQTQKKPTRVDSDVEILDISSKSTSPPVDDSNYISSRDAYMLIYVRAPAEPPATQTSSPKDDASFIKTTDTSADGTSKTAVRIPIPPYKAQQVVQSLNIVHDKACDEYTAKEVAAEARFKDIRDRVMDIYRSWNLASNAEENAVVSRQALESWLSRHLKKPPASARDALVDREEAEAMDVDEYIHEISNSDIVCIHGRLDPNKATNMKRIEKAADSRIQSDDECRFVPSFGSSDVCEECVKELFLGNLSATT